jgi:hypothetical protein
MLPSSEQVGVHTERHGRVGMAELAADVHDIETAPDEQRGIAVTEAVERQPTVPPDARPPDGDSEHVADLAVVERPPRRCTEHRVIRPLPRRGEPVVAQESHDGRGEFDLAPTGLGLERAVLPIAGQLPMDAHDAASVIDVGPDQTQTLADAQPGVGQQLEQRPVRPGVVEDAGEVIAFEHGHPAGPPAGLFEQTDRIDAQPAAPDREPAHGP